MSNQSGPSGYQYAPRGSRHLEAVNQNLLERGDKIPFVDSQDDDDGNDDELGGGGTSGNASDDEDDVMTASQEDLAMAYVNRYRMPSLAERRNQEKLTVTIEQEKKDSARQELSEEAKDKHTELKTITDRTIGLRRNSISLPTLTAEDLDALHQARIDEEESKILHVEDRSISTDLTGSPETPSSPQSLKPMLQYDDESSEEEKPKAQKDAFRSRRRGSIAPLPALRLNDKEMMANDFDTQSVQSNQNSITSINSLASLLKEKVQNVPAMIRKKKRETKDYKLRVFVGMLFLIIVFLIGYAYIMYNQKLLAKSYFDSVKLHKKSRSLRILDAKGNALLTGVLAVGIGIDKPYHCLPADLRDDGSVCYEWNSVARLYMNLEKTSSPKIKCYSFKWESLVDNFYPTDCFDMGDDRGFWYGGGLTKGIDYPLNKASFDFEPFVTGEVNVRQWGNAVKRYFLNSKGIAIKIDDETPLYISINKNDNNQFCLRGQNDNFAFVNKFTEHSSLNYQICTGPDMKTLHTNLTQKTLWDGLTVNDNTIIKSLLREPVWQIPASSQNELTETAIYNYTENVIASGYLRLGHVLVNEFWQKKIGDFTLDSDRFPTLADTVNILHRRGFRISLSIQPFICTESGNFLETVTQKLLIYERESERSIPALTRYKSLASAGVLDITNNDTIPWLRNQLSTITKSIGIDSFYLDFGTAYNIPRYYQCSNTLHNPDQYKTTFMKVFEGNLNIFGVSSAISVPRPPAFLSLPPLNSSWSGLQTIIPTVLAYGVIGYPFIMPGPVGGDFILPTERLRKMYSFYPLEFPPLPDVELYIRWLQIATFLPVLRFTHLPSEYKSESVTEIAKELSTIRQKTVVPMLEAYSSIAMDEGLPIIRPLWMMDSTDVNCLDIDNEFAIGDGMIVAPILYKSDTSREVYLPQGVWKDGIDGSLRKGNRWIHNYHVPQNKVAYFVKMPDNTRF